MGKNENIVIEDNNNKYNFNVKYNYQNQQTVQAVIKTNDGNTKLNIYVELTTNNYGRISVCVEWYENLSPTDEEFYREEIRVEAFFLNIISRKYGINNFSTYAGVVKPQSYALANMLLQNL